jgi:hypothetical protein
VTQLQDSAEKLERYASRQENFLLGWLKINSAYLTVISSIRRELTRKTQGKARKDPDPKPSGNLVPPDVI